MVTLLPIYRLHVAATRIEALVQDSSTDDDVDALVDVEETRDTYTPLQRPWLQPITPEDHREKSGHTDRRARQLPALSRRDALRRLIYTGRLSAPPVFAPASSSGALAAD